MENYAACKLSEMTLTFDSILRYGAFSPAKIIYKGFTHYRNACILIESAHRLPRENANSAGKTQNSSISFFTQLDSQMIIQN